MKRNRIYPVFAAIAILFAACGDNGRELPTNGLFAVAEGVHVGTGTITISPAGPQEAGTTITVTAIPGNGYRFDEIVVSPVLDTLPAGTGNTRTFTMPANAILITAVFSVIPAIPTFEISEGAHVGNGTIAITPAGPQAAGTTITVTATPGNGYEFDGIAVTPVLAQAPAGTGNSRTFIMPAHAVTVTAAFVLIDDDNPLIDGMRIGDYVPGKGTLIWRDEFTGPTLDRTRWNPETGTGAQYGISGWGNNEIQWYLPENAFIENNQLVLEARDVRGSPVGSPARNFTSARITTGQTRLTTGGAWTPETFSVTTGRVEARIRAPRGAGFWPAFWLLGSNSYGPVRGHPHQVWPLCGEIDILEFWGGDERVLVNAIHYGRQFLNTGNNDHWQFHSFYAGVRADGTLIPPQLTGNSAARRTFIRNHPEATYFSDGFHVYGVQWDNTGVQWELNGQVIQRRTWAQIDNRPGANDWLQNFWNEAGFSIILNIAVGGTMGGLPPAAGLFNGVNNRMLVDWVRVFSVD